MMFKPMRNPRIFVTLEKDIADAIRRIARHSGKSSSSVIAEIIVPQRQYLIQLADILERASSLPQPLSTRLLARLGDIEQQVAETEREVSNHLDQLDLDLLSEASDQEWAEVRVRGERSRPERARAAAGKPPVFNKGVHKGGNGS